MSENQPSPVAFEPSTSRPDAWRMNNPVARPDKGPAITIEFSSQSLTEYRKFVRTAEHWSTAVALVKNAANAKQVKLDIGVLSELALDQVTIRFVDDIQAERIFVESVYPTGSPPPPPRKGTPVGPVLAGAVLSALIRKLLDSIPPLEFRALTSVTLNEHYVPNEPANLSWLVTASQKHSLTEWPCTSKEAFSRIAPEFIAHSDDSGLHERATLGKLERGWIRPDLAKNLLLRKRQVVMQGVNSSTVRCSSPDKAFDPADFVTNESEFDHRTDRLYVKEVHMPHEDFGNCNREKDMRHVHTLSTEAISALATANIRPCKLPIDSQLLDRFWTSSESPNGFAEFDKQAIELAGEHSPFAKRSDDLRMNTPRNESKRPSTTRITKQGYKGNMLWYLMPNIARSYDSPNALKTLLKSEGLQCESRISNPRRPRSFLSHRRVTNFDRTRVGFGKSYFLLAFLRSYSRTLLTSSVVPRGSWIDLVAYASTKRRTAVSTNEDVTSTKSPLVPGKSIADDSTIDNAKLRIPIDLAIDVRGIRQKLALTQEEFAYRFGLSLGSVRNWEQGKRNPEQPVAMLLRLIEKYPDVVQKEVSAMRSRRTCDES